MIGRRLVLSTLAITGAGAALAAGAAGAPCVALCPPPPTAAPVVSGVTVRSLRPTGAELDGTINPGNQQTSYQFVFSDGTSTASASIPPGSSAVPVSAQANLQSGQRYTVHLEAGNASGATTGPPTTFSAPRLPPVPVTVTLSRADILLGDSAVLRVAIHGSADDTAVLLAKPAGARRYRAATDAFPVTARHSRLEASPDRNTRYVVRLTGRYSDGSPSPPFRDPSTSNPVLVYVYPVVHQYLFRYGPDPRYVGASFEANVHPLAHRVVGEPVYFYRSASRNGPLVRFASPRLRGQRSSFDGYLTAGVRTFSPGTVFVFSCVRHRILPDRGRRFDNSRCGAATLG